MFFMREKILTPSCWRCPPQRTRPFPLLEVAPANCPKEPARDSKSEGNAQADLGSDPRAEARGRPRGEHHRGRGRGKNDGVPVRQTDPAKLKSKNHRIAVILNLQPTANP